MDSPKRKPKPKYKPGNRQQLEFKNQSPRKSRHESTSTQEASPNSTLSSPEDGPSTSSGRGKACRRLTMPPPTPFIPPNLPRYPASRRYFSYPVTIDDWSAAMSGQYPAMPSQYRMPYQPVQVYQPMPVLASPIVPYTPTMPPPPVCYGGSVFMPQRPMFEPPIVEMPMSYGYDPAMYSPEQVVPCQLTSIRVQNDSYTSTEDTIYDVQSVSEQTASSENEESFLQLPKNIFPTARMLRLDPNPIIDQLCKLKSFNANLPWILDLEFGVPRAMDARPLPIYDVKYNSIHCKNTPNTIHPGFNSCSEEFKRVLIYYYDSVISTWYKGYVQLNADSSVENFQSWLLSAMQMFGMCWP